MKKLLHLLLAVFFFVISLSASAHIGPNATVIQVDTIKPATSLNE